MESSSERGGMRPDRRVPMSVTMAPVGVLEDAVVPGVGGRTSLRTSRWPMFAAAVVEQTDVGALFALPLQWGAVNLGVLDLYRRSTGDLTAAQHRDAIGAIDTASLMMLGLRTDPGGGDGLDPTAGSHAEIHQATGMVLVQLDVNATDALARLRAYAFVQQRLLVDVARDVVAHRLLFTEEMT